MLEEYKWDEVKEIRATHIFTERGVTVIGEKMTPWTVGGTKLNVGSGQLPYDHEYGWINLDSNNRWTPDIVGDWNDLGMFTDSSMDIVVSHHSLEHVGCGEANGFVKEAARILRPGGSLLVFVPDMRALAQRWILGEITEQ